jgi:hypothetical protein
METWEHHDQVPRTNMTQLLSKDLTDLPNKEGLTPDEISAVLQLAADLRAYLHDRHSRLGRCDE